MVALLAGPQPASWVSLLALLGKPQVQRVAGPSDDSLGQREEGNV